MRYINELKNKYKDSDIYVIGSGKSIDYLPLDYFDNKICIGVNYSYRKIKCEYTVIHHLSIADKIIKDNKTKLVCSMHERCRYDEQQVVINAPHYRYNHFNNEFHIINYAALDKEDMLICGNTTGINAIGLAYHLGAKNIILVGFDNGSINNETNYIGYYDKKDDYQHIHSISTAHTLEEVQSHFRTIGVNIVTLSPFIGICDGVNKTTYQKY